MKNNKFYGDVPEEICSLVNMQEMILGENELTFLPDCLCDSFPINSSIQVGVNNLCEESLFDCLASANNQDQSNCCEAGSGTDYYTQCYDNEGNCLLEIDECGECGGDATAQQDCPCSALFTTDCADEIEFDFEEVDFSDLDSFNPSIINWNCGYVGSWEGGYAYNHNGSGGAPNQNTYNELSFEINLETSMYINFFGEFGGTCSNDYNFNIFIQSFLPLD